MGAIFQTKPKLVDLAVLLLRFGVAVTMLYAGIGKFNGLRIGTFSVFTQAGISEGAATILVQVVGVLEVLAGITLVMGLLLRPTAVLILAINLWVLVKTPVFEGIFSSVFKGAGLPATLGGSLGIFFTIKDTAFIGAALLFLIYGAGKYSLDHRIATKYLGRA